MDSRPQNSGAPTATGSGLFTVEGRLALRFRPFRHPDALVVAKAVAKIHQPRPVVPGQYGGIAGVDVKRGTVVGEDLFNLVEG